jgi:hypothetical protein
MFDPVQSFRSLDGGFTCRHCGRQLHEHAPWPAGKPWCPSEAARVAEQEAAVDSAIAEENEPLAVRVVLHNEAGEEQTILAYGATVDDACESAARQAGDAWGVSDWRAA